MVTKDGMDRPAPPPNTDTHNHRPSPAVPPRLLPAEFAPALLQLMGTAPPPGGTPEPIRLGDIALPEADLRLQLAAALWEGGVLATLSRAAAAQGKRAAAEAGGQGGKRQKKR